MGNIVNVELEDKNIIAMDNDMAIELCTQVYFNKNISLKIDGELFDIFKFGNFKEKQKLFN